MREQYMVKKQFDVMHKLKLLNVESSLKIMSQSEMFILNEADSRAKNQCDEISVSELAQRHHVSPPAISRTLKKLEKKGFAKRVTSDKDRRNTYVTITERGRAALSADLKVVTAFMSRVLNHLNAAEIDQYFRLSDKLYDAMKEEATKIPVGQV